MIVSKGNAQKLKKQVVVEENPRGEELSSALFNQFNDFHSKDVRVDKDIERLLIKQKVQEIEAPDAYSQIPKGYTVFSPSSVSKCPRELFYKAIKETKDDKTMYPFQRRWCRNGSAVHEYTQRDLLYMEKALEKPAFTVARDENGMPVWEANMKGHKLITHNGVTFALFGMMDGILEYQQDGTKVGFEFKTKSTTIAQVGNYKMKDAQEGHKLQTVAYSLLFGVDEFVIMYESVAKDNWTANQNAKSDIRTFYNKVTEADKLMLLDKLAEVEKHIQAGKIPEGDLSKCIFCPYKNTCSDFIL